MQTKKKAPTATRLISLLLAIVLVTTMVPVLAFASGDEQPINMGNEEGAGGSDGTDEGNGSDDSGSDLGEGNSNTDGSGVDSGEGDADGATDPVLSDESPDGLQLNALGVDDSLSTLSDDITPMAASDDFSMIDVTFSPEKLQTYDDLKNNTVPSQLTATVQIQPTPSYVDNGRVEIPLDYNPTDQGLTNFTYGTDGTDGYGNTNSKETPDFLVLDEAALSSYIAQSNSLFTGYVIENDTLKLSLKSAADYAGTMAGLKSFQLVFSFNNDYNANIPANTVLWQPAPEVYVDDDLGMTGSQKALMAGATNEITYNFTRRSPSTDEYPGGSLTLRFEHKNINYYQSYFDTTYTNRIWVEYPAGTTFSTGNPYPVGFADDVELNINDSGYDRYYHNVSDDPSAWDYWYYNGDPSQIFNQKDITAVLPSSIEVDESFEIRAGSDYRKINGVEKHTSSSITYTKTAQKAWNLYLTSIHGVTGAVSANCGIENGDTALASIYAPMANWGNNALKNLGSESIENVEYELYQTSSDASKVNFSSIILYATRDNGDLSNIPDWTNYSYEIMVTNVGGSTEVGTSGTFTPTHATGQLVGLTIQLPTLSQGQYISSVKVTPMGTTEEPGVGELSSLNGLSLCYLAKAWDGQKWPDGTKIENTRYAVPMAWGLNYNDAEGASQYHQGDTAYVYYSSQPYAQANLVSSDAPGGVNPGSTVNYTLHGYNNSSNSGGPWTNPKVIVRVPEIMTLKDVTQTKTLTDVATGQTSLVNAKLESTANGYKYYSFAAPGYTAPVKQGQVAVFSVPLQFEVASSASPGIYSDFRSVVTSILGASFYGSYNLPMNGALDTGETLANYGLFESDNYSICSSPASSVLDVIPSAQLDVNSAVASEATGGLYVTNSTVAAKHGETTTMKLTIKNGGNIDFSNVRLYNILPFSGDNLGSEGSITFAGLSVSGGTSPAIRYTESAGYPTYGAHGAEASGAAGTADLQASTFQNAWTSGNPSNSAKAFFIDFGSQVLAAGESIDIVLSFTVPATGDQTAYNQFRFSAKQVGGSAAPLNQNAVAQGFSTKTIGLVYHDDLPVLYASGGALEGTDDLSNIPDAHFASYIGATSLTVDAVKVPSLTGYTFKGWATSANAPTPTYQPGASVAFNQAGTVNLHPVWELASYQVSYTYENAPTSPTPPALPSTETKDFYSEVTVASVPSLTGYTFEGWTTLSAGTTVIDNKFNMPANAVVFVGTWSEAEDTPYTVTHTKVNSLGNTVGTPEVENLTGTTGDTANATAYTYEGYTYDDTYDNTKASGTIAADGSLALFLYYPSNEHTLNFDKNADDATAGNTTTKKFRYAEAVGTLPSGSNAPSRLGYTFKGWSTTSGADNTEDFTSTSTLSVDTDATVYAVWQANTTTPYTVNYYSVSTAGVASLIAAETVNGTGTTGATATATVKTITGHTYAEGYSSGTEDVEKLTGEIAGDGSLVLKVFYNVNTYAVSYSYSNAAPAGAADVPTTLNVAYGTTVTLATVPSVAGYSFSGWSTTDATISGSTFVMPAKKVALTGSWTALTGIAYKVEHYRLDVYGDPITGTPETENLSGSTGDSVTATDKTYTGYTYASNYTGTAGTEKKTGTITADGKLTLKLFYTVNTHDVSYSYTNTVPNMPAAPLGATAVPYSQAMTVASAPTLAGYTFSGWTTSDASVSGSSFEMPDNAVAFTGTWTARTDTAYTTQHYLINANGVATLNYTEPGAGTTDTDAVAQARYYASHTFAANDARNITKANIKGDGTTVLKLYYNINYYNVSFVDWNGSVLANRSVPHGGSALAPASPARIGYTFIGWSGAFSNVTGSLSVTAQYRINTYTVTFVDFDGSVISTQSVTYGSSATAPANPTRTGYTFTGWSGNYTNVTSNSTVTATYTLNPVDEFTITFLGYNDVVLQSSTVERGDSVTPPSNPTRTGFRFTGWDKTSSAWTNVTADATIRAMWNGETITTTPGTTTPQGGDDQGNAAAAVAELARAAEEQGIPNIGVPLAAPAGFAAWALGSLIFALLGVILALMFAVLRRFRKSDDDDAVAQGAEPRRRHIGWLITAIVLALAGAVLFILTQDISLPMVWFDMWTIVSLILCVGVLILGSVAVGRKKINPEGAAPEAA